MTFSLLQNFELQACIENSRNEKVSDLLFTVVPVI